MIFFQQILHLFFSISLWNPAAAFLSGNMMNGDVTAAVVQIGSVHADRGQEETTLTLSVVAFGHRLGTPAFRPGPSANHWKRDFKWNSNHTN